jgi:hypothetical protein
MYGTAVDTPRARGRWRAAGRWPDTRLNVAIEQPEPSGKAVVVALATGRAEAGTSLDELGAVEANDAGLLTLRLHRPVRDPKDAWREVLARNPAAAWASPSFRDASGYELLPTGAVTVRFREKPSDKALAAFARQESLELERRTPLVPEQASFRPRRPREVYLPELVARLASRPDVAAAWPATKARYRKG